MKYQNHPLTQAQVQQAEFEQGLPGRSLFSPDNNVALDQYGQSITLLGHRFNLQISHEHAHLLTKAFILTLSISNQLNIDLAGRLGSTRRKSLGSLAEQFAAEANPKIVDYVGLYSKLKMAETASALALSNLATEDPRLAQIAGGLWEGYANGQTFGNKRAFAQLTLTQFSAQLLTAFGFVQRKDYIGPGINLDQSVQEERDAIKKISAGGAPRLAA